MSTDTSPVESDDGVRSVALTLGQRMSLLKDCLPAAFFILALIVVPWLLEAVNGGRPPKALYGFLAVVIAVCLYSAQQRARDLASGLAIREEDLLIRTWRSRRGSHRWGQFERLGRMRCVPSAHGQGRPGTRQVVTYSPASRIVWSLERVG